MFAVIKTGGKQYKVAEGDTIVIEKLDAEAGKDVTFDSVLMLGSGDSVTVGAPLVAGATVSGEIAEHMRGPKLITRKKRQRQTYRRTIGHKQHLTTVTITSINADGKAPAKKAAPKNEAAPKAEAAPAEAPKAAPAAEAPAAAAATTGADNLKKMTGVGPALEKKLNGAGITTFAQIAALSEAQIAELEEQLSLSGRFEKDGWVAQAAELAKDA
ncbi:50S ribosomal protein L21 [Hyphomonas oceanitis]|uniref:Large ribosomal subunit protein bL21 n=1 Tax=Hyphomonas oceanitis SCH89 TaxID=1280953 RepID=A0A059G3J1_9PROT|nr:50S ribosomal protein L21 [Hyphomonas oceanitis]KDA01145.1 50S ribosomal protein L21/unknown domain fusion protein [Hyphomonas oceanitis SCH89]